MLGERGIIVACVVGIIVAVAVGFLVPTPFLLSSFAAVGLFAFTLGRIHGARPWRELVMKVIGVYADVERIRRWGNGQ